MKQKTKEYFVYRYQYQEMKQPKWGAETNIDALPPTVLSDPGVIRVKARNKKSAIAFVKVEAKLKKLRGKDHGR